MSNATSGTLAEFDLVLSITEASLNAQFLHLFLTPLPTDDTQYLINHSFVLKTSPKSDAGIFGSIECPQVLMDLPTSTNENARKVKLAFKFLTNEPGSTGDPTKGIPPYDPLYDSLFKYWDESQGTPVLKTLHINGWTFSFECDLGQSNIQQIEANYLHPSTAAKLQSAIDNKSLQPASLFCLFETGTLARSFQLADAAGTPEPDQDAIDQFIIEITKRFAPPLPNQTVATAGYGLPTPENPFVLGYGVSQVDPTPLPGTPQFDPQNFEFSVTHQPNGFGTLNFLMLLGPITPLNDVTKNLNAGIFTTPFLTAIGADAPGTTGGPQYDGTLAISALAFKNQYVIKQLQPFFTIPNPTFTSRTITTDSNTTVWNNNSFNNYTTNNAWNSTTLGPSNDYTQYFGNWTITSGITSNYAGQQMAIDATRELIVDASGSYSVKYVETADGGFFNGGSGTLTANTTVTPIHLHYHVTSGAQGAWTFTTVSTKLPPMHCDSTGQMELIFKEQNASGTGLEIMINTTGSFFNDGHFNQGALMEEMTEGLRPAAQSIWTMYQAQLSNSLSSLNSNIVMPAGNVFTFNGLSLDTSGNVYTLMKYQTQSGQGQFTDL